MALRRLYLRIASALLLLLAAADSGFAQRTPSAATPPRVNAGTDSGQNLRAPREVDEFSFVVFGDRTGGKPEGIRVLEDAVTMTNRLGPAFAMTVGDMVQGYSDARTWFREMREYKSVMKRLDMPWYPVVGNHDVYAKPRTAEGHVALYKEHFGPLYYSFDYHWAHFVCLFSDEAMSFDNPAIDQNMGRVQMAWLRRDLAATDASQIFVFLHHPRWNYEGCNWDDVHQLLVDDGRVAAVIAGHVHVYRDDGVRDGIHYYTMAVTGADKGGMSSAAFDHINLVRARRDGFVTCAIPVGSVLGGDVVLGAEVDAMHALARSRWLRIDGSVRVDFRRAEASTVTVALRNPTDRTLGYAIEPDLPLPWTVDEGKRRGSIPPGESRQERLRIRAPGLEDGVPFARLRAALFYPLASGRQQPIATQIDVPLALRGLSAADTAPRPGGNRALSLDGRSAVRVDLSPSVESLETFTLECWVRGPAPEGRRVLLAKTENSSFGIFWSDAAAGRARPTGYVHLQERGYVHVTAPASWEWGAWTHVALVYDGRRVRFFVGGRPVAEAAATGHLTTNGLPFFVGADPDRRGAPSNFFTGEIDEVHLTGDVRYRDRFDPPATITRDARSRLLLHFDHDVRGIHPDDSGTENHGWPVGAPSLRSRR